ncbi:MAG: hypothetical protein ABIG68_12035, partial [Acidobacteriota bacterium]
MPERINLVGKDVGEITELLGRTGEPPFRARQVYAGIYRRGLRDWDRFTEASKALREELAKRFVIAWPAIRSVFHSGDGT